MSACTRSRNRSVSRAAGVFVTVISLCSAHATAVNMELQLSTQTPGPFAPGDSVLVELSITDVDGAMISGVSTMLAFDDTKLKLVGGYYGAFPGEGIPFAPGAPFSTFFGEPNVWVTTFVFLPDVPSFISYDAQFAAVEFEAIDDFCDPPVHFAPRDCTAPCQDVAVFQFGGGTIEPLNLIEYPDEGGCDADLDGDGVAGFHDLLTLLGDWGDCPLTDCCPSDLNGDGTVGFADLLEFLAVYGPCP